ncbi:MAG: cytidylate kinase-like family protein [Chloroflexi bacterium]|nr:cytidylate kinase-like family protein [Chloroflexota bacterium]
MSVITISREFGSEGDTIAQKTAKALGYHFVDKHFIGDILAQYGYVEFDKAYQTLPTFWERFDAQRNKQRDVMVRMLNQVIQAVAHHGDVVILGRSGFEVLSGFADVLHVRLQAPFAVRVGRVMESQNLTFDQADALVRESDKVRLAFVEEFYKVPWGAINAFDLVINTDKIAPTLAVDWILDAVNSHKFEPITDKSTAAIEVDRILADAVSDELGCHKSHRLVTA